MESILKTKQVNYEYNPDGTVKTETVHGSNFEVVDGEKKKGGYNINEGNVNISLYGLDLTFQEIQDRVENFITSLEKEEEPEE